MLHQIRNPLAPSLEEVWQNLCAYRAKLPERQERWCQASIASQKTAQVEQHEPLSCDTKAFLYELSASFSLPWCTAEQCHIYMALASAL